MKYSNFAHRALFFVVIVLSVINFSSCKSDEDYVEIDSGIPHGENSWGHAYFTLTSKSNNSTLFSINIHLDSLNIEVPQFGVEAVEDVTFSDGQKATIKKNGVCQVTLEKIDSVYEANLLRITPNYKVEYTALGEDKEVTLAPYYYQNVPAANAEPEVVKADTTYTHNVYVYTKEGKENLPRLYWSVQKLINNVPVGEPWVFDKVIAKVGVVNGNDYFVPSMGIKNSNQSSEEVDRKTKTVNSVFTTVETKTYYKFWTYFTDSEIVRNEVPLSITESVTFTDGNYSVSYNFTGSCTYTQWGEFKDYNLSGKCQSGSSTECPYLGTFVQEIECNIHNPLLLEGGKTTFETLEIGCNLYQRQ